MIPMAFFSVLVGLFMIVSRGRSPSAGSGLPGAGERHLHLRCPVAHQTMLVELGILLDVFVGVFVMGIAIFHINREFDHIEARPMTGFRDWSDE